MLRLLHFIFIIFFLFGCQTDNKEKKEINFDNELTNNSASSVPENYIKKIKFIFYNMLSSLEKSAVFEISRTVFNNRILSNYIFYSHYSNSKIIVLVLGIYSIDMDCLRMFEQKPSCQ